MTASSNNQFLLLCNVLIISAAVLCHGEPVLDSDGNEVGMASTGSSYVIQKVDDDQGGVAKLYKSGCQSYVSESSPVFPGNSVVFTPGYPSDDPVLQTNARNRFAFFRTNPPPPYGCNRLDDWIIGPPEHDGTFDFLPILAGQSVKIDKIITSWFEVRSTGERGIYKLAACECLLCPNICPEVGTFIVNGKTVLGIGGETYRVRFVKVRLAGSLMETAQL